MAFPDAERVIYEINPLEEVICQLRFPPVLKIDAASPVAFQERVRANYPFYKSVSGIHFGSMVPPNLAEIVAKDFSAIGGQLTHQFASKEGEWTLSLNRENLTLTCKRYTRWEEFRMRFSDSLTNLLEVYAPSFFVRIGLRYRNMIRRSQLGLKNVDWSQLLQPWIIGPYSSPEMKGQVDFNALQMLIRLQENRGRVLISCGASPDAATGEECYLIDGDFSIDRHTESRHALDELDFLNSQSDRFFHWCIRDRLDDALRVAPRIP